MKLVDMLTNVPTRLGRLGLGIVACAAAEGISTAQVVRTGCLDPAGRVIAEAPLNLNPNPFGVVYDSENERNIMTDKGSRALYTTDDEGGNEELWLPAPLSGAGRGIAIGGKDILGEDRIWVLNDSPSIDRFNLAGGNEGELPGIVGTGLAYHQWTNTLFVMNNGVITQYDPLTGTAMGSVDTGIVGGLGLAILPHEHIDARVFFTDLNDPDALHEGLVRLWAPSGDCVIRSQGGYVSLGPHVIDDSGFERLGTPNGTSFRQWGRNFDLLVADGSDNSIRQGIYRMSDGTCDWRKRQEELGRSVSELLVPRRFSDVFTSVAFDVQGGKYWVTREAGGSFWLDIIFPDGTHDIGIQQLNLGRIGGMDIGGRNVFGEDYLWVLHGSIIQPRSLETGEAVDDPFTLVSPGTAVAYDHTTDTLLVLGINAEKSIVRQYALDGTVLSSQIELPQGYKADTMAFRPRRLRTFFGPSSARGVPESLLEAVPLYTNGRLRGFADGQSVPVTYNSCGIPMLRPTSMTYNDLTGQLQVLDLTDFTNLNIQTLDDGLRWPRISAFGIVP